MTKEQIQAVLENVRSWPEKDQEELAELAREIQARRSGFYVLTEDERAMIARGQNSPIATDDEIAAFWKAPGIG